MKPLLNRDISFLSFNQRVLDEASKKRHTLGDKVLFHGITFSNLDEFMQVRYPASVELDTDDQIKDLISSIANHYTILTDRFRNFNEKYKIVRSVSDLNKDDRKWADSYFNKSVYPALLFITADKDRTVNVHAGMYILVITEKDDEETVGYIEIPNMLDRFIPIPGKRSVIAIEDLIQSNLKSMIHGCKIVQSCPFSILRSAEVYTQTDQHLDPYNFIKAVLAEREESWITKLEIGSNKKSCIKTIRKLLPICPNTIIFISKLIRLTDLKKISTSIYKDGDSPRKLKIYNTFPLTESIFDYIKRKDRLCFHPYESYDDSMVRFLEEASTDPDVVSIRICLYRVSDRSRIIDALLKAADMGKSVVVLVELKARFDEKHNMQVSNILREGGIRIVYTKPNIKTHAKVCLVARKEKKGLRVYSHIGTGNYSESNSKLYTDYSYFTADQDLGNDLTQFFNLLTSDQGNFKSDRLIYAPYNLKSEIIDNINKQIKLAKNGHNAKIIIKCNAITDEGVALKLIEASEEGVEIILIVRSACVIQPKKNIKIYSIVGSQLEHSRVYVFGTGKNRKLYIGSADLMTRNMSRRNELMIQVKQKDIRKRIMGHIRMYLKDTVNRRRILSKYRYENVKPKNKEDVFNCHEYFRREAKKLSIEG